MIEALESRRLLSTTPGLPDTTFNTTGTNTLSSIPNIYYGGFLAVATQTDGKSVAVGFIQQTTTTTGTDILIARFNTDGSLDSSFGGGKGYAIQDIGSENQSSANLKIQADGKILVLTSSGQLVQNLANSWIIRFNADGTVDTAFGGSNTGYIASTDTYSAFALQGDGSILAAGSTTNQTTGVADAFVKKYTSAGTLVSSFGTGGVATKEVGTTSSTDDAFIYSIVQDNNGNILLGGTRGDLNIPGNPSTDGLVIRFTSAGVLDTTFGSGKGFVSANANAEDFFQTIQLLPDNGILLAGNSNVGTNTRNVAVLEFDSTGKVIGTFQPSVYGTTTSGNETNNDVAVRMANGDIVGESGVFGASTQTTTFDVESSSFIYRLTSSGTLDSSFGSGGKYDIKTNQAIVGEGASLQADGSLVVAGVQFNPALGTYYPVIARYNGDAAGTTNGSISGNVFNDADANGVKGGSETNLAGVDVYLDTNDNGSCDASEPETVTDANGNYSFSNLAPGSFLVRAEAPTGFTQTVPAADGAVTVVVAASKTTAAGEIGFTNAVVANASISGIVYTDANDNGTFDGSDTDLSGVTVALTNSANATTTKISAADGSYSFTGLAAGTYTVSETTPAGYTQTQPTTTKYTLTLTASQSLTSENFGNFKAPVAPTFSINNVTQNEGNSGLTDFTFTITRTGDTSKNSSVNFATADGTATAGVDYAATNGVLGFGAGVTTETVTVQVAGDTTFEADETFTVNLTNAVNGTITTAAGTGTILNDDAAPVSPTVAINDVSLNEGNSGTTAFVFTVTRSGDSTQGFEVDYATADGTATVADGDYQATSGTLTFAPGTNTQTITVLVNGDTKVEPNETFTVNLSNFRDVAFTAEPAAVTANAAVINPITKAVGTGTIINDDTAVVGTPSIVINNVSLNEGNSGTTPFVFTVTNAGDTTQAFTVDYATADGTATVADNDYQATSGTLTFAVGDKSHTVTVLVDGDTKYEANETFTVNLSNFQYVAKPAIKAAVSPAVTVSPITTATGTGTIVNDDAEPSISINNVTLNEGNSGTTAFVFTVTRKGDASVPFTVDFATKDGTATVADNDYQATSGTLTFNAGDLTKTITVLVNGDTNVEPNETFTVNLSNLTYPQGGNVGAIYVATGTGTIVNDDSAVTSPTVAINDVSKNEGNSGTTAFVFTVTRSGDTTQTDSVDYATADGTATVADNDYQAASGTLIFGAGVTTQTITVLVNGDTKVEPNEIFTVDLSNFRQRSIEVEQGVKAAVDTTGITKAVGTGTIVNDDSAVVLPTLAINSISKNEGNAGTTAFTFTVTRSGDTSAASSVAYATADGTAFAASDYTATSGTLNFVAGQKTATITVLVNGDTAVEGDETFFVNLASPTGATIANAQGTGTIKNDDSVTPPPASTRPFILISNPRVQEGNSGLTAMTFTLTLTQPSTKTVTVSYKTADGPLGDSKHDYVAKQGKVTFKPGQTTATITIYIRGNIFVEPNETFFVKLFNAKNAGVGDPSGTGTILNDDFAK